MTTMYAAAKYQLLAEPEQQWRELSDLLMVAVELVRLAQATGRDLDDVFRVLEEARDTAEYEWEQSLVAD